MSEIQGAGALRPPGGCATSSQGLFSRSSYSIKIIFSVYMRFWRYGPRGA